MPNFPADPKPDYPIEEIPAAPEVLISVHRDGSEQRRYKGAGRRGSFRLRFGGAAPLTSTERAAILDHYAGQNGILTAFLWTHPERGSTHLVRYAEPPAVRLVAYNAYEVDVLLEVVPV